MSSGIDLSPIVVLNHLHCCKPKVAANGLVSRISGREWGITLRATPTIFRVEMPSAVDPYSTLAFLLTVLATSNNDQRVSQLSFQLPCLPLRGRQVLPAHALVGAECAPLLCGVFRLVLVGFCCRRSAKPFIAAIRDVTSHLPPLFFGSRHISVVRKHLTGLCFLAHSRWFQRPYLSACRG